MSVLPDLTNFTNIFKKITDISFALIDPSSTSAGRFSFTISNNYVATINGRIVNLIGIGSTIITARQEAYQNFLPASISTILYVDKGIPILSNFPPITKIFTDGSFELTNPSSNSPGNFTFISSNENVATIIGNIITIKSSGNSIITAIQSSTQFYQSKDISANLEISKGTPTLSNFFNMRKNLTDNQFTLIDPSSNNTGTFTFTSSNNSIASINERIVYLHKTGTIVINARQQENDNFYSADISVNLKIIDDNNIQNGLIYTAYEGAMYSNVTLSDNVNYFDNNISYLNQHNTQEGSYTGITININSVYNSTNGYIKESTSINNNNDNNPLNNYSIQWLGYFIPDYTGRWKFWLDSNDGSYLWIGNTALTGYTKANAFINNGGLHLNMSEVANEIDLVYDTKYPIRIQFYDYGQYNNIIFSFMGPSRSSAYIKSTNLSGLFYNEIPTLSNFPDMIKKYSDISFSLIDPSSNSTGNFTFQSSNTNVATINERNVNIVGVGDTTITAIQTQKNYYTSTYITANLRINLGEPTFSNFTDIRKRITDVSFVLLDPSSNSNGGFTYRIADQSIATITSVDSNIFANVVTLNKLGTTTITATQAATNYYAQKDISVNLIVDKAIPILNNFPDIEKFYTDISFVLTNPSSNSSGNFTFTSSNQNVATINNNIVTIRSAGNSIITATQESTDNYTENNISANLIIRKGIPTLNNFPQITKRLSDVSFVFVDPSSNSSGKFTYESFNKNVAYVTNNVDHKYYEPWGIYCASDFSNNILYEYRRNGRNAICSDISLNYGGGYGARRIIPYLNGTKQSTIIWPEGSLPQTFTLCTITRATSINPTNYDGRLFSSDTDYFIHGHYNNKRGIAYHGNFLYNNFPTGKNINVGDYTDWLVMCAKNSNKNEDLPGNILVDGVPKGIQVSERGLNRNRKLTINAGIGGYSDFNFSHAFIWDKHLTNDEMMNISDYLLNYLRKDKYSLFDIENESEFIGVNNVAFLISEGNTNIIATQKEDDNYISATIETTLSVQKDIPNLYNFYDTIKKITDVSFTLFDPFSNSPGKFTFTSSNTSVAIIEGRIVNILDEGTTIITATQDACGNFSSNSISINLKIIKNIDIDNGNGLNFITYEGAMNDNFDFFNNNTNYLNRHNTNQGTYSGITTNISSIYEGTRYYISGTNDTTNSNNIGSISNVNNNNENINNYSVKWYGYFVPDFTGTWTFSLTSNDGSYLWINDNDNDNEKNNYTSNNLVINNGGTHNMINSEGTKFLISGKPYNVLIYYYDSLGGDVGDNIIFKFKGPSGSSISQMTSYLYGYFFTQQFYVKQPNNLSNFQDIEKTFGNVDFSLNNPLSNSDGNFTFEISDPSVAIIYNQRFVRIIGAGTTTIVAKQASTENYSPASISARLIVTKGTPMLYFPNINTIFNLSSTFEIVDPSSNSNGSFTFQILNTSVASINDRIVNIHNIGTTTIIAKQMATENYYSKDISANIVVISSDNNTQNGLKYTTYDGSVDMINYVNYFDDKNQNYTGITNNLNSIDNGTNNNISKNNELSSNSYAVQWLGYFIPDFTGIWQFWLNSYKGSYLWIGNNASSGYTINNALINNTNVDNIMNEMSNTIDLSAGVAYPVRIQYFQSTDIHHDIIFSFMGPTGSFASTKKTDLTGLFYSSDSNINIKRLNNLTNFPNINKIFGDIDFSLNNPISSSSATFTFESSNPYVATINNNNTIQIHNSGRTILKAIQESYETYSPSNITAYLDISTAIPSLYFPNITKKFGDIPFIISNPISNSYGDFTFDISDNSIAVIVGNMVYIVGVGSTTIRATQQEYGNYSLGVVTCNLIVNRAVPYITNFSDINKIYSEKSFLLQNPFSNSLGVFNFTSSNENVIKLSDKIDVIQKTPWGIYCASDFSNNILYEYRRNGRNAICTNVSLAYGSGNGANIYIPYLYGDLASKIVWPIGSLPENFTLCTIARITKATDSPDETLFSAKNTIFIHGYYGGKRGISYHGGYLENNFQTDTNRSIGNYTDWLVMCAKNTTNKSEIPGNILVDGIPRGIRSSLPEIGDNETLTINAGFTGYSSFAFSHAFIWDQHLTNSEMAFMSECLLNYIKYGQPIFQSVANIVGIGSSVITAKQFESVNYTASDISLNVTIDINSFIQKKYESGDARVSNNVRISQVINTYKGGKIQYGNYYLDQPININYLGRGQGMPGGSGMPLKNKFR